MLGWSAPILGDGAMPTKRSSKDDDLPRTIEDAVTFMLARLSPEVDALMRNEDNEERMSLEFCRNLAGMSVRAMLGLWGKNPKLMADLSRYRSNPDDASHFLLMECWKRMKAEAGSAESPKAKKRRKKPSD
jgi:hypothetical protein